MASHATDTWQGCYETVTQHKALLHSGLNQLRTFSDDRSRQKSVSAIVDLCPPPALTCFYFLCYSLRLPLPLHHYPVFPHLFPCNTFTSPLTNPYFRHSLYPVTVADSLLWLHPSSPHHTHRQMHARTGTSTSTPSSSLIFSPSLWTDHRKLNPRLHLLMTQYTHNQSATHIHSTQLHTL